MYTDVLENLKTRVTCNLIIRMTLFSPNLKSSPPKSAMPGCFTYEQTYIDE